MCLRLWGKYDYNDLIVKMTHKLLEHTQETNHNLQTSKVNVNTGVQTLLTHIEFWRDWFHPTYALPVVPQPHLLITPWGAAKK